jgi:hypothetical protein
MADMTFESTVSDPVSSFEFRVSSRVNRTQGQANCSSQLETRNSRLEIEPLTFHASRFTHHGFTLMSVPLVYNVKHRGPMRQAVYDITQGVLPEARRRAILTSSQVDVIFDAKEGTISISSAAPASGTPAAKGDEEAPRQATSATSSGAITSTKLPDDVAIEKFVVNLNDCMQAGSVHIRFYPNGTCDEMVLRLRSTHGDNCEITTEVTTALVSVEMDRMKFRSN